MAMEMAASSPTMGLQAPLFLAIWVTMMVAMMFPTAAPMILAFNRVQADRQHRGRAFVPTWMFVAGYMVVWTLAGLAAYLAQSRPRKPRTLCAVSSHDRSHRWSHPHCCGHLPTHASQGHMSVEVPLADRFHHDLLARRDAGALRMGLVHGGWCLGCCWLLFVILFPLGMMNIAAMAAITVLIFAEKALPWDPPGSSSRGTSSCCLRCHCHRHPPKRCRHSHLEVA